MNEIVASPEHDYTLYDALVEALRLELKKSTYRVYRTSLNDWRVYTWLTKIHPFDITPQTVRAWFEKAQVSKPTGTRHLAALKRLLSSAALYAAATSGNTEIQAQLDAKCDLLKRFRLSAYSEPLERTKKALKPSEAQRAMDYWQGATLLHKRNRAVIALLLLSGLRRSEAAVLVWSDINFEEGLVTVRQGKGDKARIAPIAGEQALEALKEWHGIQGERHYVFCAISRDGKSLRADKPISGNDIWRIVIATTPNEPFKPHDARRTLITEALATGTPLADVQAIAGHANAQTTLVYAQASDAATRRKNLKLRYG